VLTEAITRGAESRSSADFWRSYAKGRAKPKRAGPSADGNRSGQAKRILRSEADAAVPVPLYVLTSATAALTECAR
jgi:hypothetical protein